MGFARHLVRLERKDGLPRIVIRERASGAEHAIAFDEEAYSLGLIGSLEYDTDVIRFTYSSMTTPSAHSPRMLNDLSSSAAPPSPSIGTLSL